MELNTYEANGLRSVIVTVQEICPVYPGRDNAEKLRNFIRDAYITWGVRYVPHGYGPRACARMRG